MNMKIGSIDWPVNEDIANESSTWAPVMTDCALDSSQTKGEDNAQLRSSSLTSQLRPWKQLIWSCTPKKQHHKINLFQFFSNFYSFKIIFFIFYLLNDLSKF